MFTVADELFISGLDDDTRAIIERYVESKFYGRYRVFDEDEPSPPRAPEVLAVYQRGWRDGIDAAARGETGEPTALPPALRKRAAA